MGVVTERYTPKPMAANSTFKTGGSQIGGFICSVAGTINVYEADGTTAILSAFPMAAGVYYPLPFALQGVGAVVVLSGGAAGTLLT